MSKVKSKARNEFPIPKLVRNNPLFAYIVPKWEIKFLFEKRDGHLENLDFEGHRTIFIFGDS